MAKDVFESYICGVGLTAVDPLPSNPSTGGGSGLYGIGSPEGAEVAEPGTTYADVGADPVELWIKTAGSGNVGWVPLIQ